MNGRFWILVTFQAQFCLAILKIENLDPITSSNKSAIFYVAENCQTFVKLDIDFIRPVNQMMVKFNYNLHLYAD
jgi:hypothetical protein